MVSPWHAALASAVAFTLGAALPFLAVLLIPDPFRVPRRSSSSCSRGAHRLPHRRVNDTPRLRPTARLVVGGALALAATFALGSAVGALAA